MPMSTQYSFNAGTTFATVPPVGIPSAALLVYDYSNAKYVNGDIFHSVKNSQDELYMMVSASNQVYQGYVFFKILVDGSYTYSEFIPINSGFTGSLIDTGLVLSRDESQIFFVATIGNNYHRLFCIDVADIGTRTLLSIAIDTFANPLVFSIYQNRYIWLAGNVSGQGNFVWIHNNSDYTVLDNDTISETPLAMCVDEDNICYVITESIFYICSYNTLNTTITITHVDLTEHIFLYAKQMLIDKWGDLIILLTTTSSSTLKKYSKAGVEIDSVYITTPMANLNTDKDGNYYYSTDIAYYKIAKNIINGAVFNAAVKIRSTGSVSYCNNDTSYNQGTQA